MKIKKTVIITSLFLIIIGLWQYPVARGESLSINFPETMIYKITVYDQTSIEAAFYNYYSPFGWDSIFEDSFCTSLFVGANYKSKINTFDVENTTYLSQPSYGIRVEQWWFTSDESEFDGDRDDLRAIYVFHDSTGLQAPASLDILPTDVSTYLSGFTFADTTDYTASATANVLTMVANVTTHVADLKQQVTLVCTYDTNGWISTYQLKNSVGTVIYEVSQSSLSDSDTHADGIPFGMWFLYIGVISIVAIIIYEKKNFIK